MVNEVVSQVQTVKITVKKSNSLPLVHNQVLNKVLYALVPYSSKMQGQAFNFRVLTDELNQGMKLTHREWKSAAENQNFLIGWNLLGLARL